MKIISPFIVIDGENKKFNIIGIDKNTSNYDLRLIVRCKCCNTIRYVNIIVNKRRTIICKNCGVRQYVRVTAMCDSKDYISISLGSNKT